MRYLVAMFLVLIMVPSAWAEIKEYNCFSVNSENKVEPNLRRMKASVVVPDAYLLSQKDLLDTAKAAALELYEQSKMDVIVIKIFPNEAYAQYFPQVLDLTYAPKQIGWDGKTSSKWVAFIADKMPDEKQMFKISTWIVEQAKYKKVINERKVAAAQKLKLPEDDVYYPIFTLIPCMMENNG